MIHPKEHLWRRIISWPTVNAVCRRMEKFRVKAPDSLYQQTLQPLRIKTRAWQTPNRYCHLTLATRHCSASRSQPRRNKHKHHLHCQCLVCRRMELQPAQHSRGAKGDRKQALVHWLVDWERERARCIILSWRHIPRGVEFWPNLRPSNDGIPVTRMNWI